MKRTDLHRFRDLPNVGVILEQQFLALGMHSPSELVGKDPYKLYRELCRITRRRQDPCVLDVFISAVRYMEGGPARKWWEFTAERKQHFEAEQ
jgi:hypothetical protein